MANQKLTLEQVQKKIADYIVLARKAGPDSGKKFEEGLANIRQTAEFMFKVVMLGDEMNISPLQFQDAMTGLMAIGGPSVEMMMPGVIDFYSLLMYEKVLQEPKFARFEGLFHQKSANA